MSAADVGGTAQTPLDRLLRWELFGGHWRVRSRTSGVIDIALLTCDGGEEADRLVTDDAAVGEYVGNRGSDED